MRAFLRPHPVGASVIVVFALLLCVPNTMAQVEASAAQPTILVLITAPGAEPALLRSQLTAFIDNQPAEIQDVVPARGQPLVFAILLDTSGSLKGRESFQKEAASDLFRALAVGPNIGYFGDFNDELYLSKKPASLDAVLSELREIGQFRGGTALYDSVLAGAKLVNREAEGTPSRRAIFVLTDGDDNTSKLTLKRVIPELQREAVPVFCIGLLEASGNSASWKRQRQKSVTELRTISDSSGGVSHFLASLTEFIPSVIADIDSQYWLTLISPSVRAGKMHSLMVTSGNTNLRIAAPGAILVR